MESCKTFDKTVGAKIEEDDDIGEFYFESDAVALKGNQDYMNLLKSLAILEAQRISLIQDYEQVLLLKEAVLKDPLGFVEKLQAGWIPALPDRMYFDKVPNIDWSKYNIALGAEIFQSKTSDQAQADTDEDIVLVRGRVFDETKPVTFNKLWSHEEQRKLEELLLKYPPEEIETNRWKKIAAELGNRTPKQVCSRVQKYFQKLHRAGLPIPGRIPKTAQQYELLRKATSRHQKHNQSLLKPTTFFPTSYPPVYMSDVEGVGNAISNTAVGELCTKDPSENADINKVCIKQGESADNTVSKDNDSVSEKPVVSKADGIKTEEYRNLQLLLQVRKEKCSGNEKVLHEGYRCRDCGELPIHGTRWHCAQCRMDLCSDCVAAPLLDPRIHAKHPSTHGLSPIRLPVPTVFGNEGTFGPQTCGMQTYVDPNFLP